MLDRKSVFESKIKPLLQYIGTIGAILMSIAYIVVVLVLVVGFKVKSMEQSLVFAAVNAVVGLIIMQFLKIQGIDFAKALPENQEILSKFYTSRKKNKYYSIKYYWTTSLIKDVIVKGVSIAVTSAGLIYIVIEGSSDYNLLLLAIVNLIMFICFGFLSMTSAYDFFNEKHMPWIEDQLLELEKKKKEAENGIRDSKEWSNSSIEEPSRTSTEE